MKKVSKSLCMALVCVMLFASCNSITHVVGSGGTSAPVAQKQWYILFGLVPLNHVDSKAMAAGAENYTVTTKNTFLDQVITIFTSIVTIHPMTVEVRK